MNLLVDYAAELFGCAPRGGVGASSGGRETGSVDRGRRGAAVDRGHGCASGEVERDEVETQLIEEALCRHLPEPVICR